MVARYFAYGSNMNPDRVRERGVEFVHASAAALPGFTLVFDKTSRHHEGVGHANLRYAPGSRVEGVLYWLATRDEIGKMDRFESTPVNYSREVVRVLVSHQVLPGDPVQAATGHPPPRAPGVIAGDAQAMVDTWTYFANPAVRSASLKPPRSYLNHLLAGRSYLSDEYYAMLERWPCEENR